LFYVGITKSITNSKNVNTDVLTLNYAICRFISKQTKLNQWGSGIIKMISEKLQKELPGLREFGYENLIPIVILK